MPWHPEMNIILNLSTFLSPAASVSSVCLFGVLHDISSWGFGVPYQRMKWNSMFLLEDVNSLNSNYQWDCSSSLLLPWEHARDDPLSSLSTDRKSSGCLSSPPLSFITFPVSFKVLSLLCPAEGHGWLSDSLGFRSGMHTESFWVS